MTTPGPAEEPTRIVPAAPPAPVDDAVTEPHPMIGPAAPADDDLVDEDWDRPRRTSRLTAALAVSVLVVLGFAAGAATGRSTQQCTAPPPAPAVSAPATGSST